MGKWCQPSKLSFIPFYSLNEVVQTYYSKFRRDFPLISSVSPQRDNFTGDSIVLKRMDTKVPFKFI